MESTNTVIEQNVEISQQSEELAAITTSAHTMQTSALTSIEAKLEEPVRAKNRVLESMSVLDLQQNLESSYTLVKTETLRKRSRYGGTMRSRRCEANQERPPTCLAAERARQL
jgi:hypothetical protein